MFLQACVNFLKFLLGLCLVRSEIILLLKLVPNLKLVNKICKEPIHLVKSLRKIALLEDLLDLVLGYIYQEFIGIDVLRQRETCKKHVNKILYVMEVEAGLKEL